MATVTFLVHPERPDALALAIDTADWLDRAGPHGAHPALQRARPGRPRRVARSTSDDVDLAGSTVAVSLGGDGTFLRVGAAGPADDVPGARGQLRPARLPARPGAGPGPRGAAQGLRGQGHHRGALRARGRRSPTVRPGDADHVRPLLALNEVVIEKIDFGHTVRLATSIDGEEALTYSADGLIVATPDRVDRLQPLGRRARSWRPTLRAMVVTPVAPHLSLDRSLVLTDAQEVRSRSRRPGRRAGHRRPGRRAARARVDRHLRRGRRGRCGWCATNRRPSAASCASACWPTASDVRRRRADRAARARPRRDRGPDALVRPGHDGADRRDRAPARRWWSRRSSWCSGAGPTPAWSAPARPRRWSRRAS